MSPGDAPSADRAIVRWARPDATGDDRDLASATRELAHRLADAMLHGPSPERADHPQRTSRLERTPAGRPVPVPDGGVAAPRLSITPTRSWAGVAVHPHRHLGLDREDDPDRDALGELLAVALGAAERDAMARLDAADRPRDFTLRWAAKEAVVKALGTGFARDPDELVTSLGAVDRHGRHPVTVRWAEGSRPLALWCRTWSVPGGAAALAVAGYRRVRIDESPHHELGTFPGTHPVA